MAIVNLKKRQIECKIVYYGPGRCGKTTNLEYIHKSFKNQVMGEMVSINTDGDRTLFFDFLPLKLNKNTTTRSRIKEKNITTSNMDVTIEVAEKINKFFVFLLFLTTIRTP